MEEVKKTDKYVVYKKGSGRYAVRGLNRKFINGADKLKILVEHGLVKLLKPKAKADAAPPAQDAT